MRVNSQDIKELKLLKHYRIIRKWACKSNNLNDADLELLIYLESIDEIRKHGLKKRTFGDSWKNRAQTRLLKQG